MSLYDRISKPLLNKYSRLKRKVALIREDISFLRACLKNRIVPKFIKVSCAVQNSRTNSVINVAKNKWLRFEIKFLFSKLSDIELELYELHLYITSRVSVDTVVFEQWVKFDDSVLKFTRVAHNKKRACHHRKLLNLISDKNEKKKVCEPKMIPDFVVNLSNEQFTEEELNLLNRGLKFTPKPNKIDVTESIVDIETILKYKLPSTQDVIREKAIEVIENVVDNIKNKKPINNIHFDAVNSLKQKNCVYVKADKGNKLVVLDKTDYENQVKALIVECKYKALKKTPLPSMIRESDALRQRIGPVFGNRFIRKLIVSNPNVPLLYCLPKIHKEGKKLRPIVSSINSPTYKMAKWLVNEIRFLPPIKSRSVKNIFDFVKKVENVHVSENEMMVSFDVTSLFPSIDVDLALAKFDEYLNDLDISNDRVQIYSDVAKLCMKQNYFQFRDKFYRVDKGTNMGNPLSPIISECFMATFENKLEDNDVLPRVWHRYVDDVFAVIDKNKKNEILDILNSQFPTIKFTCETEIDNKLAFLDTQVIKKDDHSLEFSIYHKPTSTMRVITSDSHCPFQYKQAAFHSMAHRLCTLPLSIEHYKNEYDYMKSVAVVNGYQISIVDNIIKKHAKKAKKLNATTLTPLDKPEKTRVSVSYIPQITNKLKNIFNEFDMSLVYKNNNKLSDLLGNTKDKKSELEKSGIYRISCSECNAVYVGQTRRTVLKRFNEHLKHIEHKRVRKSAFAAHAIFNEHLNVNTDNVELLRSVRDEKRLDAYECVYIHKNENKVNQDNGNIDSVLFSLA